LAALESEKLSFEAAALGCNERNAPTHSVQDDHAQDNMPTVACILMQKDERFLLKPWIAYYSYLFGIRNIYIIDNGSQLPEVNQLLDIFEAQGGNVNRNHMSRADYEAKGDIVGEQIRTLDAQDYYDFIIPLDCDEFIVMRDDATFSWSRENILSYLETLRGESRALRFPYHLANHPVYPDLYHYFSFFKSFFSEHTFKCMDHGYHLGQSTKAEGFRNTQLVQLHFHYKPHSLLLEQARRSWVGTVDVDDHKQLMGYSGPSVHLASLFLKTRHEFYHGFLKIPHFYLPDFRRFLVLLGAPLDLPTEYVEEGLQITVSGAEPSMTLGRAGTKVLIPRTSLSGVEFLLSSFNERDYLDANPDLTEARVDPTEHFSRHGFREQRPLRTQDTSQLPSANAFGRTNLAAAVARRVVEAYVARQGSVQPGADGLRCLELGAGTANRPGWLETDLAPPAPHVLELDVRRRFPAADKSFDFIYSEHMIEHVSFEEGRIMLRECFRVAKPGGIIRIVTPSIGFLLRLFSTGRSNLEDRYIEWATSTFLPNAPTPQASFVFKPRQKNLWATSGSGSLPSA